MKGKAGFTGTEKGMGMMKEMMNHMGGDRATMMEK
jgi:hypothetical protein